MKTQNLFLCPILMTWAGQKWIGNHFWTSQSEPAEELFTCVVHTLIFLVLTYEHLIVCKKGLFQGYIRILLIDKHGLSNPLKSLGESSYMFVQVVLLWTVTDNWEDMEISDNSSQVIWFWNLLRRYKYQEPWSEIFVHLNIQIPYYCSGCT